MAEALLGVLLPIMTTLIEDEFGLLRGVKEDLRKLQTTLNRIKGILEAADEHQFSNKELKIWLEDLIGVAYDADDVVDEFATTKTQQSRASGFCNKQVCKFLPPPLCFKNILFRHKIGHKLKAVIKRLDECEAKRPNIPQGHPNRGSENQQGRETGSFVLESKIFGREEDRAKIVELLLTCVNSQENLSIIPIVGMGGIGKTTLAQLFYSDTRIKDHFELTLWVCVSEDFDHKRLLKAIIGSAGSKKSDTMDELQKNLQEKLKGKKFLLVLDDVWNDKANEWERLKDLLTCGGKGSSVLVTTRSKRVAQIMGRGLDHYDLNELSMDDCWSLFKERAFREGRREEHPKLVEIGKEIVEKCKGVPLAAKTLGSLMGFKSTVEEWLSIKESELWQTLPEEQDDIFPALRLSYINLPHRLRRCFVFCSVFPKDYEMDKEELVHMWMANGLVQYGRGRELEDSHETFNELFGRSFFQDIEKDEFGDIRTCKIHDLMHDLTKSVSRDECYSVESKEAVEKVCERTKHLLFDYGYFRSRDHSTPTMSLDVAKRLRSLIFESFVPSEEEADQLLRDISKYEFLRILCLPSHTSVIRKIPSCIKSLKHLRYLNSSSTEIESVPNSIGNLLNLKILKLGNCDQLKKLPNSIGNLLNLQIMDLRGCGKLENLPESIGNLGNLKILKLGKCDHLKKLPESIGNLGNLQILELRGCDELENLPESIGNLGNFQILDLEECFKVRHLPKELRKMRSLKHLNNEGIRLTHMPTGIGHLRDLQTLPVFVVGENEGCLIKELGELDWIKGKLFIEGLSNVARARDATDANLRRKQNIDSLGLSWHQLDGEENIDEEDNIDEEVLEALQPHSNLKKLSIDGNRGLKFPDWVGSSSLTQLVELKLLNCRNCEKLPSLGQLPSLKSLKIKGLHGVKYMGNELYGSCEQRGFPSLETLELAEMENLEEVCVVDGKFRRNLGEDLDNFVALKSLEIWRCPKLVSLPEGLKYLEELNIWECENLMSLPEGLTSLKDLSIWECNKIWLSGGFNTSCAYALESGISNKQVCKFLPSPLCFKNILFRHKIGHKLKAVIKRLDDCEAKKPNIPQGHPNRGSENQQGRETDSFVYESEVFGRDEDKEKIVELLLTCVNSQENLSIIPIVGKGGIGKTTLAQLVYNDPRVKGCFDLTIWVCVFDDFDHNRLIRAIIESVTKKSCDLVNADPLQEVLRKELNGKKFLLVLDDVWNDNENDWERLKNLLTCGRNGSSVLVTTRSPIVAKIMGTISKGYNLAILSMDACWSLFKKRAFGDGRREDPKLVEIGKDIVNKCGGVPLAAKTLGSLMRSKSEEDEWLSIKESELWQSLPEDKDHILPALRLSYIHLPYRLRRCFVFCSVFPKDYKMEKEELVHLWMANGLVQYRRGRELEDSHETFNELLGRSFFQDIEKDEFGDVRRCKIHDLMHDLAKSISRDECYSVESKEAAEKVCERTKHLLFYYGYFRSRDHSTPTMSLDVAKRLRSLIFERFVPSEEEADQLLRDILKFEFLRILCLHSETHEFCIRKIPSCIESLKHLRYLNSSSTKIESLPNSIGNLLNLKILKLGNCDQLKKLPNSIGNLLNLQILDLRGCGKLENLPESIGNLGNLQILDLQECFQLRHLPKELRKMRSLKHLNNEGTRLTHMPTGIGHLRDLQTLPVFVVGGNEGYPIKELRELDRIKGKLLIKGLSNVACERDAIDVNLRRKQNIDSLGLSWHQLDGEENIDEEVLEALQPHSNLKKLSIDGNRGLKFPHWVGSSSLTQLVELKLLNCRNCEKLPSLGQLPSLKSIKIKGLDGVKYMGNELYGSCEQRGFPSLETLELEEMGNLEEICVVEGREHFPGLQRLSIWRCPKLIKISGFPFPSEVTLGRCEELTLLPEGLLNCTRLLSLNIANMEKLVSLGEDLDNFGAMKSLKIWWCPKLVSLPEGLKYLKSLEKLEIGYCENLMSLPEGLLTSLKELSIWECNKISCAYALENLRIRKCTSLPEGMHCLTALRVLEIANCPAPTSLPEGLKSLKIRKCENLTSFPEGMHHLTALQEITLMECPALASLEGIHHLTALRDLVIGGCKQLSSLPDSIQDCTSLQSLTIRRCGEELVRRYEKERGAEWDKIAHIPNVIIY